MKNETFYEVVIALPSVMDNKILIEEAVIEISADYLDKNSYTGAELTVGLNVLENFETLIKWRDIIWDVDRTYYKCNLVGTLLIRQYNKEGVVFRTSNFEGVQIKDYIKVGDKMSAVFTADYWTDYYDNPPTSKPIVKKTEVKSVRTGLKEEIQNIITHLLKIDDTNLFRCIEMLHFFMENYPDAPGSSSNHQAYKGGYYKHVNDILNYAVIMYNQLNSVNKLNFKLSDAILVLFLHDIEKPIKYCETKEYITEEDFQIRRRLIRKFGIELSEDHTNALKYIHGEGEDYRKDKRVMSPLCAFCHCCDIISARIFYK